MPVSSINSNTIVPKSEDEKISFYASKFKTILKTLHQYYDDTLDIDELSDKTFNAMLAELDPFSKYFNAKLWKSLNEESEGESVGIGVELFKLNDTINIINVAKASSADKAGLIAGDKILAINDSIFIGKNTDIAEEALNGEEKSIVKLKIMRISDGKIIEIYLAREDYNIPSISTSFIVPNTKILYLKLARFSNKSHSEILNEMQKYEGRYSSLILDLKDNQGGNLGQVIKITQEWTSNKDTILLLKSKSKEYDSVYVNDRNGKFHKIPTMVVINEKTASASEIFSGVMQDLDRGIVVGQTSLGKGLVQRAWTYTDSSAFRITVAKYFTPSGRLINKSNKKENLSIPELELRDEKTVAAISEIASKFDPSSVKVCKSRKGRPIISFGGIFPDIQVEPEKQNKLTSLLKSNGYILTYSLFWYTLNYQDFVQYNSPEEFATKYIVSQDFEANFLNYIKGKNMYEEEMYIANRDIIFNFLKAYIAYYKWGNEGHFRVLFDRDTQVKSAIENIQKAQEMVK